MLLNPPCSADACALSHASCVSFFFFFFFWNRCSSYLALRQLPSSDWPARQLNKFSFPPALSSTAHLDYLVWAPAWSGLGYEPSKAVGGADTAA
jgi:hypothetical protein